MTIVRTNWLLTCLFAALGLTTAYGQVNFENYGILKVASSRGKRLICQWLKKN